jgi:hypothetical protein
MCCATGDLMIIACVLEPPRLITADCPRKIPLDGTVSAAVMPALTGPAKASASGLRTSLAASSG